MLSVDHGDGFAVVTLERPEKRNALSIELRFELADAVDGLAADEAIGCAVLTGAGSAFSSGMDTTQFGGDEENKRRLVESSERMFGTVATFPKPLVAAVNGHALAGGFALALLCDVRIASTEAQLGFTELARRHIPPSYAAARSALPDAVARDLCVTGRMLDARQALAMGVVSEVVEPEALMPRAREHAAGVGSSPRTATETKRRILLGGERTWMPLLEDETRVLREALLG
ncbi:MAG: enoyl-CoA hydratase/isomerase family protein [Thermoleophilaceae bacterium]